MSYAQSICCMEVTPFATLEWRLQQRVGDDGT